MGRTEPDIEEGLLREVDRLRPRLIETAQLLIRTPSVNPPGDEREVAEIIREKLTSLGLKARLVARAPRRPNVLATLQGEGGAPDLLFNGHMDVVPPGNPDSWSVDPFGGSLREGRIYGRGAADMKGALASIITALNALVNREAPLAGSIIFHAVADEEAGSNHGTKYLVARGLARAHYGVVAEGSVFGSKICLRPAVRGSCWIRLETFGRAAHASNPKAGVHAVLQMAKLLIALQSLQLKHQPHYILPPPTITPGTRIAGGEKVNVIPDRCVAEADIRTIPGMTAQNVLQQVQELIESMARQDPNFKARATIMAYSEPAEVPRNSKIVRIARGSAKRVTGAYPEFRAGYGSNDSTYLINQAKIPTICGFGPGDHEEGNAHGPDENVSIDMMVSFAKIYALMCLRLCGAPG
jgi:succinyl-diaminopimelate desuccinylase